MRLALAAAALALLAGGTACGERSEPTGPAVRLYPVTVTDAQDRNVTLTQKPTRVVALTAAAARLVRSLGVPTIGRPAGFYGPAGKLVVRRVEAARPDLVVSEPTAAGADLPLGAPEYLAPTGSLEEVEQALTRLGLLLDRPLQARQLVRRIRAQQRLVDQKLADVPFVSVFLDLGFFTTVPTQSLAGDLIRQAHGRNVAGDTPSAAPFDLKLLLRLNPAVYLATSDSGTTLKTLRREARTRRLRAVKTGRFAVIDLALLQPGPRVGDGLVAVARALHPDAFR